MAIKTKVTATITMKPAVLPGKQTEHDFNVIYPSRVSEFEVHSLLFYKLKKKYEPKGYDVRGEVVGRCGLKRNRFDIVIFLNYLPQVIIEVKKNKAQMGAKQMNEYLKYGVPLLYCKNKRDIPQVIKSLDYHFNKVFSSKIIKS